MKRAIASLRLALSMAVCGNGGARIEIVKWARVVREAGIQPQ